VLGAGAPACLAKWRKAAAKLLELEVDEGDDEDDDEDDERRPPAATTTLLLDPLWWRVDWLPLLLPLPLPLTLALDGGEIPADDPGAGVLLLRATLPPLVAILVTFRATEGANEVFVTIGKPG